MEARSDVETLSLVSSRSTLGSSGLDVESIQSRGPCSDIGSESRAETKEGVITQSKRARGKCLCLSLHLLRYCACPSLRVYLQLQLFLCSNVHG